MSSDVCTTCKHRSSCTYPRNQVIVQCEEYEYSEPGDSKKQSCEPALAAAGAKAESAKS